MSTERLSFLLGFILGMYLMVLIYMLFIVPHPSKAQVQTSASVPVSTPINPEDYVTCEIPAQIKVTAHVAENPCNIALQHAKEVCNSLK